MTEKEKYYRCIMAILRDEMLPAVRWKNTGPWQLIDNALHDRPLTYYTVQALLVAAPGEVPRAPILEEEHR